MSVYLGNNFIGNGNYLGSVNITDNNIFVPPTTTTTTTTAAPTTTTTTLYTPLYWNVRKCGTSDPTTQLAIQHNPIAPPLLVGYAIRPTQWGVTPAIALPGYENACYELISTATSGILCGIRAPAASCAQSVCTNLPTTTTTTTAAP